LPRDSTEALIITPTRELAQQIDDVLLGLAYHTPLRAGLLVGGTAMGPQEKALRAGVDVLIATPGRLLDHMRQNQARFDHLHTLVLDEADRMLDMGFLPDLRRIIARLPARRQTLLFSATMPPVIARLARDILRNPLSVQIGQRSAPVVGITQAAYPVPEHLKTALLRYLLRHTEMPSVLVFTRTKLSARRLARSIAADGFAVGELHSNLTQPQRSRAMDGLRRGDFQVLVATNIAARGLDVCSATPVEESLQGPANERNFSRFGPMRPPYLPASLPAIDRPGRHNHRQGFALRVAPLIGQAPVHVDKSWRTQSDQHWPPILKKQYPATLVRRRPTVTAVPMHSFKFVGEPLLLYQVTSFMDTYARDDFPPASGHVCATSGCYRLPSLPNLMANGG
jgi:hypothetical protein